MLFFGVPQMVFWECNSLAEPTNRIQWQQPFYQPSSQRSSGLTIPVFGSMKYSLRSPFFIIPLLALIAPFQLGVELKQIPGRLVQTSIHKSSFPKCSWYHFWSLYWVILNVWSMGWMQKCLEWYPINMRDWLSSKSCQPWLKSYGITECKVQVYIFWSMRKFWTFLRYWGLIEKSFKMSDFVSTVM